MKPDHILVRFGELTTKGKNRKLFIRKLLKNTKEILHDYSALEYELTYDRLYIYLNEENAEEVTDKLKTIFGIHNFSLCYKVEKKLLLILLIIMKEIHLRLIQRDMINHILRILLK